MPSLDESKQAFNRLFAHFNRAPRREAYPSWHAKIAHIPAEALQYAIERIEDEAQAMPLNLPKALKDGWMAWQNANPERIARQRTPCKACDGRGEIMFEKLNPDFGKTYRFACRCGHCRNWYPDIGEGVPLMTLDQVRRAGGTICERYPGELAQSGKSAPAVRRDPAALVADMGEM